ncbi:DUF981 domain-containing protein [Nocardia zapadnayensis]|uniref:DUF981 family protein n=1 Tax=Nocardia rhamnosiphila TaxID=426716 RepID=UPI0022478385|nr:DUF981 family protein [Nocardia zapadnayensis]MCX0269210.1 DUF981 domain-containing protein [Nocardia zapadnayensis]
MVITYTTLMGLAAGLGMILLCTLGYHLYRQESLPTFDGWAFSFAALGGILTVLGGHMTLTWPLQAPERFKNFMFGEPLLLFGVLLIAAAVFLRRSGTDLLELCRNESGNKAFDSYLLALLRPVVWIVFAMGLVLTACTVAAFQYDVFATAPQQEPLFGTGPMKRFLSVALCLLYALPAVACLLVPFVFYTRNRPAMAVSGIALFISGAGWLATAVLVYYTHIGMDFNFRS